MPVSDSPQPNSAGWEKTRVKSGRRKRPYLSRRGSTLHCMTMPTLTQLVHRTRPCGDTNEGDKTRPGNSGEPALARAKVDTDGSRDSWHSGGLGKHLVCRELPVLLEGPESRGEEAKRVQWEHPIGFVSLPPSSPHRPGGIPVPHLASEKPAGGVSVSTISTRRELRPQLSIYL